MPEVDMALIRFVAMNTGYNDEIIRQTVLWLWHLCPAGMRASYYRKFSVMSLSSLPLYILNADQLRFSAYSL